MKTIARNSKPKKPNTEPTLYIARDAYDKLSERAKKRYHNPNGDKSDICEFVNGELRWVNAYDAVLQPIEVAVSETICHDLWPPSGHPIDKEEVVNGQIVRTYYRRTNYECGTAHFGLCLPDAYFDCRHNAFENAAQALEGIAKILTDAAARVRKCKERAEQD